MTSVALSVMGVASSSLFPGDMSPDSKGLPGSAKFLGLTRGLEWWGVALALVGLVIGAATWALGSHSQNFQQSVTGRRAVLISGLAALLIGAAPAIITFFFTQGAALK